MKKVFSFLFVLISLILVGFYKGDGGVKLANAGSCWNYSNQLSCIIHSDCQWVPVREPVSLPCSKSDCEMGVPGCQWMSSMGVFFQNWTSNQKSNNSILSQICIGYKKSLGACIERQPVNPQPPSQPATQNPPSNPQPHSNPTNQNSNSQTGSSSQGGSQLPSCLSQPGCPPPCVRFSNGSCRKPPPNSKSQDFLNSPEAKKTGAKERNDQCFGRKIGPNSWVMYPEGTVAIGGSTGYAICQNGRWVPCRDCQDKDLTTVPNYKTNKVDKDIEDSKKGEGGSKKEGETPKGGGGIPPRPRYNEPLPF